MKSGHAYAPLYDLDDPYAIRDARTSRRKGLWIILALTFVIAFALGVPFYGGPAHSIITDWASGLKLKDIRKSLKKADIIPDIIDDFDPAFALSVSWTDKHDTRASLGNTLKPDRLQDVPEVYLTNPPSLVSHAHKHKSTPLNNIVIVATDPDAPSRKDNKWSEFCHWIAVGVPFVNTSAPLSLEAQRAKLSKPLQDLITYKPPGPPPKTGKHRYIFLAFTPRNDTSDLLDLVKPSGRQNWGTGVAGAGVKGWANDMGLAPIAANYFYAKNKKQ